MKKIFLLFVFIFVICSTINPVFAEVKFTMHSDPENKFYLKVPDGWLDADNTSAVVVYIIVATAENDPVNSLNVQKIPVTIPSEEHTKGAIDILTKQLLGDLSSAEGFKLSKDAYSTINDRMVRETDVKYLYNGKPLRQTQGILYNEGFLYVIVYTADNSVYDKNIYKNAISSFDFYK